MNKKPVKLGYYDKLPFGKHKNKTVARTIDNDHDYIQWAIDNNLIELDNEAFKHFENSL